MTVTHLAKSYQIKNKPDFIAVNDVSFEIPDGRVVAFLGPNGAGKTTTVKMLLGLITPSAGTITIAGQPATPRSLRSVGAVLEGSRNIYWRLSPTENFEYWGGIRGVSRRTAIDRGVGYLDRFHMADKARQPVRELSRGMQQIVAICCALIHQPQLLLLDEPTLGLDLMAADRIEAIIRQLAREQHLGVLLTTHDMAVAQALSDDVLMIEHGQIVFRGETQTALRDFSAETYQLHFSAPLTAQAQTDLAALGTVALTAPDAAQLTLAQPDCLPMALKILATLPIDTITKQQVDLGTLFKQIIQSHQKAGADHADRD